jgi:beta-lactamase class A
MALIRWFVALALLWGAQVNAQSTNPAAVFNSRAQELPAVLAQKMRAEDYFAPAFLAEVPARQINDIAQQLTAQYGQPQGVKSATLGAGTSGNVELSYEKAVVSLTLTFTPAPPHKVIGLLITAVRQKGDTAEKLKTDIAALPGRAGFLVKRLDGAGGGAEEAPLLSVNADQSFAIASGFKLWVLAETARAVNAKERRWSDVIPLGAASLPSGITQNWPAGAPMTLHSLAVLMISISDNSATDTLMRSLGRARVDGAVAMTGHARPSATTPVLTTVEAFALKMDGAGADRRQYLAAKLPTERARLLSQAAPRLTRGNVNAAAVVSSPLYIDQIEWFASPNDMARTMDWFRITGGETARSILAVSKGFLGEEEAARFAYVGYKGGSETGVLSAHFLLKTKSGAWYSVTTMWNDSAKAVAFDTYKALVLRAIQLVK